LQGSSDVIFILWAIKILLERPREIYETANSEPMQSEGGLCSHPYRLVFISGVPVMQYSLQSIP